MFIRAIWFSCKGAKWFKEKVWEPMDWSKRFPWRSKENYQASRRRRHWDSHTREVSRRRNKRRTKDRSHRKIDPYKIARKLNGEVIPEFTDPVIRFRQDEFQYRAFLVSQHGLHSIRIQTDWPDAAMRLRIFPQGRGRKFLKMDDIEVGDERFDRDFVIQGQSVDAVRMLLTRKVRKSIGRHRKYIHGRININIVNGQIECGGLANQILKNSQIVSIARHFAVIHRNMWMAWSNSSNFVADVSLVEKEVSTCMVCGDHVSADGVECVACDTRHHRDCWEYIGKCSTYGCRSRKWR